MGLIFILDNLKKKFKHASSSLESVGEVQGPFTEDWKVTLVIIIYELLDLLPKMLASIHQRYAATFFEENTVLRACTK